MSISPVTEGLSPELCRSLGFGHMWPDAFPRFVTQRLEAAPDLRIGILRRSARVLLLLQE